MDWTVRGLNSGRGGTFRTRPVLEIKKKNSNFIATLLESLISIQHHRYFPTISFQQKSTTPEE